MAPVSWVVSAWVVFVVTGCADAQDPPTANCREYTVEGETFICRCAGGCLSGETPTRTWPGHSDTDRLEIINITRQQQGQNFTCRKVCGDELLEVNYTLQVAYGPDKDSAKITGPIPFSTNGTPSMILMCEAIANPTPDYSWSGVTCDNGNDISTCIYTPSIQDDGKRATCEVTNSENILADSVTVHFDINLWYPPQTAPDILSEGSGSILTAQDILTCTVTGGKPLVDSVNFTCTSPYHVIQGNPTNTSVSSSLTIDTSQATTDNMTCYCSANWAPRPEFYTMKSERHFMTESEYPAKVKNFVLNDTNNTVTVTESEHTNVTLQCEAVGRPGPGLLLRKTSHYGTVTLNATHVTSKDVTRTTLGHDITMADWTDMGIYTCIAWNDVGDNDSTPITLNVNSPPRPASEDPEGKHRNRPFNMTTDHKTVLIDLLVYPAPRPEIFTYTRYANESDQSGVTVSPDRFNTYVTPRGPGNNFVTVTVRGRKVPDVGVYKVTISNNFGRVEFYFAVNEEIHPPDESSPTTSGPSTSAIAGGVVGGLAFVVVAVVVTVIVWKRKYRKYEKPQPRREDERSPYTDLQPPPFVNSEEGIVNYANTEPRPDLSQPDDPDSYVNVETRQNTYEQMQPRSELIANAYTTLYYSK